MNIKTALIDVYHKGILTEHWFIKFKTKFIMIVLLYLHFYLAKTENKIVSLKINITRKIILDDKVDNETK